MALKVSPEEIQAASHDIRGMIHEYNGALQNYLQQTEANMGPGGWNGPASGSNYNATQDIHQAQTNLTTRWGHLCDILDQGASNYAEQEHINAQRQGAVAQ